VILSEEVKEQPMKFREIINNTELKIKISEDSPPLKKKSSMSSITNGSPSSKLKVSPTFHKSRKLQLKKIQTPFSNLA